MPLHRHLYQTSLRSEDASELCQINGGLFSFSYEMQFEGKVITMTFLPSLKPFLPLLMAPSGLFSPFNVTNKHLIVVRCCHRPAANMEK